ncbi:metallophosphoesterase [Candidatus Woesearchaeota archaeon]|nr:metallophosphoesterase [Candidatus Woesearchaeota archaeon]
MKKRNLILAIIWIILLLSLPSAAAYRFVVISDTHLATKNIEPAIEKIINLDPKPEFVIHTGDMIKADNVKSPVNENAWQQVNDEIISPLKEKNIMFFPVRGNHDAGFKERFIDTGDIPKYYYAYSNGIDSMNNNNDLFLFLDGTGFNIEEEQMNWLKSELNSPAKNYKNLFVFSHEPLADLCKPGACTGQLKPNDELVTLFKNAGVTIFFNGHQHFFEKVKYQGINLVTSGYLANYQYIPKSTGIEQKPTFVVVDVNGPNNVQVNAYQKSNGNFDSQFDKQGWADRDLKATLGSDFEPFSLTGTTGAAASTPSKGASIQGELVPEFILVIEENTINIRYEPEGWRFSNEFCTDEEYQIGSNLLDCDLADDPSKLRAFLIGFLGTSSPDDQTFQYGVEKICNHYSNSDSVLFAYGEKIEPKLKEDCIDKINQLKPAEISEENPETHPGEGIGTEVTAEKEIAMTDQLSQVSNCPDCCVIDKIWIENGILLNIQNAIKNLIYTLGGNWLNYKDICEPKTAPTAITKLAPSEYDVLIKQHLTSEMIEAGVTLPVVRSLISHESGFNTYAISTAGCIGLMQICSKSAGSLKVTTCCTMDDEEGKIKQSCTKETAKFGHSWKESLSPNPFKCAPSNDERFNQENNIKRGTEILSACLSQCGDVTGAISCFASGSCIKKADYAKKIISKAAQ